MNAPADKALYPGKSTHYCVARSMIVTCNADMSVPLNARVLATVGKDDDQAEVQEMLSRANAAPALLEALQAFVDAMPAAVRMVNEQAAAFPASIALAAENARAALKAAGVEP